MSVSFFSLLGMKLALILVDLTPWFQEPTPARKLPRNNYFLSSKWHTSSLKAMFSPYIVPSHFSLQVTASACHYFVWTFCQTGTMDVQLKHIANIKHLASSQCALHITKQVLPTYLSNICKFYRCLGICFVRT